MNKEYSIDDLIILHNRICSDARELMTEKNHDYRGGDNDPFSNFKGSTAFGVSTIDGVLIRMQDKMKRIQTFDRAGKLETIGESFYDAIVDIINYAVIIAGIIEQSKEKEKE